jgi:hypothetical protein
LSWSTSPDPLRSALGYARFVAMVQPEKGKILIAKTKALIEKIKPDYKVAPRTVYVKKPKKNTILADLVEQNRAANAEKKEGESGEGKPWWKFW